FDFLENKWATNVLAYDNASRGNLLSNVDRKLTQTATEGDQAFSRLVGWLDEKLFWAVSAKLLGLLLGLLGLGVVAAIGWFLLERWRLRRTAARIGLDNLSPSDQVRLAKQLGFYDDLMRLLERHRIS